MEINNISHLSTINKSLTKMLKAAKSGGIYVKEIYLLNLIYKLYSIEINDSKKICLKNQYYTLLNKYPRILCKVTALYQIPVEESSDIPDKVIDITDSNIFVYPIKRTDIIVYPDYLYDKPSYTVLDAFNGVSIAFTEFTLMRITLNSNLLNPNKQLYIYDEMGNDVTSAFTLSSSDGFNHYSSQSFYVDTLILKIKIQ